MFRQALSTARKLYNTPGSLSRGYSTTPKSFYTDKEFYSEEKYVGISKEPFSKEITDVLLAGLDPQDIEIKPDGLIYLPEIKYRRILNSAFGPGGWALKPFGPPIIDNGSLIRPYALYCLGRYVAESIGEQQYNEDFRGLSMATATEAAKSNALVRCCKDLGIGSSLWDPIFIRQWKTQYATERFFENQKTKEKRKFWILKNGVPNQLSYPWKEIDFSGNFESVPPASETIYESPSNKETKPWQSKPKPNNSEILTETSPTAASAPATSTNQEQEIDIDDIVPPQMKKYAGKTWRELIAMPKGQQYIAWVASSFSDPNIKLQAQAILEFFKSAEKEQSEQSEQ